MKPLLVIVVLLSGTAGVQAQGKVVVPDITRPLQYPKPFQRQSAGFADRLKPLPAATSDRFRMPIADVPKPNLQFLGVVGNKFLVYIASPDAMPVIKPVPQIVFNMPVAGNAGN